MKDQKDGSLLFEVTVNNEKAFIRWILQYGPAAEILKPQAFRDAPREQLAEWWGTYS